MNGRNLIGLLLVIAAVQYSLLVTVCEALRPNYSISKDSLSDLGVGSTAPIYNGSAILLGILTIISSYLIFKEFKRPAFAATILLTGVGAAGVGIFPETVIGIHGTFALLAFLFGAIAAMYSALMVRAGARYLFLLLGIISISMLVLDHFGRTLGLGPGGIERMIVYPVLIWSIAFGGYLIGSQDKKVGKS